MKYVLKFLKYIKGAVSSAERCDLVDVQLEKVHEFCRVHEFVAFVEKMWCFIR